MMNDEYISIAEYAKIKGVSTSAIYKRLKTTLKPFYAGVVDGVKVLRREVLTEDNTGTFNPSTTEVLNPPRTVLNPPQPIDYNRLLEEKEKQIEELKKELAAVRQQCEEKDRFIMENTQKIITVLEQSQELQRNNQILMANQQETKRITDGKANIFTRIFSKNK